MERVSDFIIGRDLTVVPMGEPFVSNFHDLPLVVLTHMARVNLARGAWRLRRAVNVRWTFYVNNRDGAWVSCAGIRTDLRANRLVLIPGNCHFDAGCQADLSHTYGYFEVQAGSWASERLPRTPVAVPWEAFDDQWAHLSPELDLPLQLAVVARLTLALGAVLRPPNSQRVRDPVLSPAFAMIQHDFARPLAQDELARACGLTAQTFARRFAAVTGTTPVQALRRCRVDVATRLLGDTDLDLETIALRTGLTNRTYLTRVFRIVLGVTPGAYRKALTVAP